MNSLLALLAGIMIGIAQVSTKYIFNSGNKSLFVISLILLIYFLSAMIWFVLLKLDDNLAMLYGILILGSFLSIILGNQILVSKKIIIYTKEVIAIILISAGCYLLK